MVGPKNINEMALEPGEVGFSLNEAPIERHVEGSVHLGSHGLGDGGRAGVCAMACRLGPGWLWGVASIGQLARSCRR